MLHSVFLGISQNCNQNCIFCSNPTEQSTDYLSYKEIALIIKDLKDGGVTDLRLYGGEPFMNKDIFKIIKCATKQNMQVSMYTNGTIISKKIEKFFKQNAIKKMIISIDGPNAKIHEIIRQSPGSFDKTVKNIKTFIELGVTVDILFTICALNKDYIFETHKFLKEIGVNDIKCNLVSSIGRAKNNWQSIGLNNTELQGAAKDIAKAQGYFFKKELKRKECHAGSGEIFIKANGDVYPCVMFIYDEYKIGNVREKSILNIYNSSVIIEEFKNIFNNKIYCPDCSIKSICGGGCRARAFAIHKNLLSPDSISCLINKGGKL